VYFKVFRYDFKSTGNAHNPKLGQLVAIRDYKKILHEEKPSPWALRKSNWLQRIKHKSNQNCVGMSYSELLFHLYI